MKFRKLCKYSLLLAGVCIIPALSYAAECTTPKNLFVNPFNKNSAHHRPIGSGAVYASTSHPSTQSWLSGPRGFGLNVGAPWGVSVTTTDSSDPVRTIGAISLKCDRVEGLPRAVRLPKEGFDTRVKLNANGCTDGVVVIYDGVAQRPEQLRQYNWNGGKPVAGQYKTWDIKGLGHGKKPGDRVGTSAAGVAALFGILRGDEINDPSKKVEHALQMILPSAPNHCAMRMGRQIVLPAVSGDRYMNYAGYNLGNIPYGGLMALPPVSKGGPNLDSLGLTARGKRIAEAVRDYGIYAVDTGNCTAIRTDQFVNNPSEISAALSKIYPYMRMVLNNDVLGSPTAGGGTALAPNCAFDAGGTTTPPPTSGGGECGSADGGTFATMPDLNKCVGGWDNLRNLTTTSTGWSWQCVNDAGTGAVSCSAKKG